MRETWNALVTGCADTGPVLRFRLLGGVEGHLGGARVDLGHPRQRGVLAVLLVEANRPVPAARLLDRVWGERPPARGRDTLYNYLSRLRAALSGVEGVALARRSGGYLLTVDEQGVDLHRFRRLLALARSAGDDRRAAELFDLALGLWRGEPVPDLDTPWACDLRAALGAELLAAESDHADLALRRGRHGALLPALSARAARHPLDERVAGQLMLALYRDGRQADALEHYRRVRTRLADDLGADPGPALQRLHRQILTADPALHPPTPHPTADTAPHAPTPHTPADTTPRTQAPHTSPDTTPHTPTPRTPADTTPHTPADSARPATPVPRQLPAAPPWFTGRADELAALTAALGTAPTGDAGTVPITAIGGAGGIGKTALALHWAHRNAHRFPDGHLFVDLHGFSPTHRPVPPDDALRGFLAALGVAPDRVPDDPAAKAALYRSLVAGKRVLVVLDNAAGVDQVEPLLPGSPTCAVLVTGRHRLAALIDRYAARHLRLDVLTRAEAHALLAARVGAARVAAEPDAAAELVDRCGRHPLALSITARHASTRPGAPLAEPAAELRLLGLHLLDHDDPTASLPTVLSWSLRRLTPEQRRVFALLGIAPGPDTGLPAAIALTGLPPARAHRALTTLEDASLIDRHAGGRHTMHDLIRDYATTLADDLDPAARVAALRRAVDFYLHTAHAAQQLLDPHTEPLALDPPAPGVHPQRLPDAPAALAWLDSEYPHLSAAQHTAFTHRWHRQVWQLARTLSTFHARRGHRPDEQALWEAALDAATHLPDPATRIHAHRSLGRAHIRRGRPAEAIGHLDRSLALARAHDARADQALTHRVLAEARSRGGDNRRALHHARRALDICRALGDPVGQAAAHADAGWVAALLGDHGTAREHCRSALALNRDHRDDPEVEAHVLDTLGYVDHHTGRHAQAVDHYRQALTLYRPLGSTYYAADTLDRLGHPHLALGRRHEARAVWRQALELYRRQGREADADRVLRQLRDLGDTASTTDPDGATR
ncbi:AfsR/SARP family transcriptional regulator [Saccharothrix australiensis]|uniref:DNA-binding SARP family transcriptional activator n=1 Tax=Saccharothrix australiensis TaxID=2072 RepID=A0A495W4Y1_9PSEU|nr:BTAD domain-containing putative transcriptional regulator [Saccharothrix australiensis]RKT55835.1 DNA-binding SARP family transcriptional activator [Saccharothrix australiensis]